MAQTQNTFMVDTNLQLHKSGLLTADTKLALCTVDVSEDTRKKHNCLDHDDHVKHITRHVVGNLVAPIGRKELLTVLKPDEPAEGPDNELDEATKSEISPIRINTTTICYYLSRDLPYEKPRGFTTHVLVNLYTCLGPPPDGDQVYQRVYFGKKKKETPKSSWNYIRINENSSLARQPQQGAYTPGSREMAAHVIPVACKITLEQITPKELVERKDTAVNENARSQARNILQALQPKLLGRLATDEYIQVDKCEYPQEGILIGYGLELRSGLEHDFKVLSTSSDAWSGTQPDTPAEIAVASVPTSQLFYQGSIGLHSFMSEYSKFYPERLAGRCSNLDFEELDAVVRDLKVRHKPDDAQPSDFVVRGLPSEHVLRTMKSPAGSGDFYVSLKKIEGLVLASSCTVSANQPFQHKPHRLVSESKQRAEERISKISASLPLKPSPPARKYKSYTSKPQYTDRVDFRQAQHFQDSIRLIFVEIDSGVPSPEWPRLVTALKHKIEDWGVGTSDRVAIELSSKGSIEEYHRKWTAKLQSCAKNGNTKRPIFIFATKEKKNEAVYNLIKRIFDVDLGYQSHMVSLPELRCHRKDNGIVTYAGRLFSKILTRQPPMTSSPSGLPVAIGLNICSVAQSRTEKDDSQMYLVAIVSRAMRYSEAYRTSVTLKRGSSFKELNVDNLIRKHIPSGVLRVMIYRYGEYFSDEAPDTVQTPETNQIDRIHGNRHTNPTGRVSNLNSGDSFKHNSDRNGTNERHTGNNSKQTSPTYLNASSGLGESTPNFHSRAAAANQELQYLRARLKDQLKDLELRYILVESDKTRISHSKGLPKINHKADENIVYTISAKTVNISDDTITVHRGLQDEEDQQPLTRLTICGKDTTNDEDDDSEDAGRWTRVVLRDMAATFHDDHLNLHDTKLPIPTHLARLALKRARAQIKVDREDPKNPILFLPQVHDNLRNTLYYF